MESLVQKVISNNEEIFQQIISSVKDAKSQILIASAWFTDDEIFNALKEKSKSNIDVQLIVADNEDNNKLPFEELKETGASVLKIKNVGYGIMHQKFCVIDHAFAIHGSYNYTKNARKNNHESVIFTNFTQTVNELKDTFHKIKERAERILSGDPIENYVEKEEKNEAPVITETIETKFKKLLDELLLSEVKDYDRDELINEGFEKCKDNNGNASTLNHILDSIYYNYVQDSHISEDRKKLLEVRITDLKNRFISSADNENETTVNHIIKTYSGKLKELEERIAQKKSEIDVIELQNKNILESKIPSIKKEITSIRENFKEFQIQFINQKAPKYKLIFGWVLFSTFFLYLFFFYSSAGYTLIFSEGDLSKQLANRIMPTPPSVMNSDALSLAAEHGFVAIIWLMLFVFIPVGFTLSHKLIKIPWLRVITSYILGIFVFDFLIAILISKSMHRIDVLLRKTDTIWSMSDVFSDPNFYTIFVLGAAPLFVFKFVFDYLLGIYEEFSPEKQRENQKLQQDGFNIELARKDYEIIQLENEVEANKEKSILFRKDLELFIAEQHRIPVKQSNDLKNQDIKVKMIKDNISNHADNTLNLIKFENPRLIKEAMNDRISAFLSGWVRFLYSWFADSVASEKTELAYSEIETWKNANKFL